MASLKVGDDFPAGVHFSYVPYSPENEKLTACGIPMEYDASKEFANKKVVLLATPGAFTPTCSVKHLPPYIEKRSILKGKGIDLVAVIASNDAWVMEAWRKANGVRDDILFMCDSGAAFSKKMGWTNGERLVRYAMVIDNGRITYAEREPAKEVTVSGVEAVLTKI